MCYQSHSDVGPQGHGHTAPHGVAGGPSCFSSCFQISGLCNYGRVEVGYLQQLEFERPHWRTLFS
jgi:hypothetical protein